MAKILVFETAPEARQAMAAALVSLGHEVVPAADGYSVLPLAEQHRPDLIVLDYRPPEVDGFEILTRLRNTKVCAATPILFASATPKFEIEFVVMDAPAIGYADKPLDLKQLKESIDALLGSAKLAAAPAAAPPATDSAPAFTGEADHDGVRDEIIDLD